MLLLHLSGLGLAQAPSSLGTSDVDERQHQGHAPDAAAPRGARVLDAALPAVARLKMSFMAPRVLRWNGSSGAQRRRLGSAVLVLSPFFLVGE